jgi:predicted DCC family thiol-disulfide oxidoreductase YuxK
VSGGAIVLFDGVCNFCHASVLFIIDRDPKERFSFAPLQSDLGRELVAKHGLDPSAIDTIVLVDRERDRVFTRSGAALRIARELPAPWPLAFYLFAWIPAFVRDFAYDVFAKNRYRWFGRTEECRLPTPEIRRRFLG